ncbi:MAG: hypothetical protein HEQ10_17175 [Dolichospermum sp. DEX182a]|nr:hypothetical protein [Dolichospermum sp. DEX182a]
MPNAIISTASFQGNGSQENILNAINSAMLTAGFTLLKSYTVGGLNFRVWNFNTGGTQTYANLFLEFGFTNNNSAVSFKGYSAFNSETNTGSNPSGSTNNSNAFGLSDSYIFQICSHPEIRGVFISVGGVIRMFLGYFRPDPTISSNNWWNQNNAPYAYIPKDNAIDFPQRLHFGVLATLQPISSLAQGNTASVNLGITEIISQSGNSNTPGRLRALYPATMSAHMPTGLIEFAHMFSPDVVQGGVNGMYPGDYCSVEADQYAVWNGNTINNTKLLIKTA